jgi:hypothetical protein
MGKQRTLSPAEQVMQQLGPIRANPYQATPMYNSEYAQQYEGLPVSDETLQMGVQNDLAFTTEGYGSQIAKNIGAALVNTLAFGASTVMAIPNFIDNQFNDGNDRLVQPLNEMHNLALEDFQSYQNPGNEDQSVMEWLTPSWISGNTKSFWGDLIEQSGIIAGTTLGTGALLGAARFLPGMAAAETAVGTAVKGALSKVLKPATLLGEQLGMSKAAANLVNSQKFVNGLASAAKTTGLNAVQSYTEALFQGLDGERNFIEERIKEHEAKFGSKPEGADLAEIENTARELKDTTFKFNMGGLMLSNTSFTKAFFGGAPPNFLARLGKLGSTLDSAGKIVTKELDFLKGKSPYIAKPINFLAYKAPLALDEGFEEIYQMGVEKGLDNYYTNKLNTEDFEANFSNVSKALSAGAKSIFTTEGLKAFIAGAGVGGVFQGAGNIMNQRSLNKYLDKNTTIIDPITKQEKEITNREDILSNIQGIDKAVEGTFSLDPLARNPTSLNQSFGERVQQFVTDNNNFQDSVKAEGSYVEYDQAQRTKFDSLYPYVKKGYKDVIVSKIEGVYEDLNKADLSDAQRQTLAKQKQAALEDVNTVEKFVNTIDNVFYEQFKDPDVEKVHKMLKDMAVYHMWNTENINKQSKELSNVYGDNLFEDEIAKQFTGGNIKTILNKEIAKLKPVDPEVDINAEERAIFEKIKNSDNPTEAYFAYKQRNKPDSILSSKDFLVLKKQKEYLQNRLKTNADVLANLSNVKSDPAQSWEYIKSYYSQAENITKKTKAKVEEQENKITNKDLIAQNIDPELQEEVEKELGKKMEGPLTVTQIKEAEAVVKKRKADEEKKDNSKGKPLRTKEQIESINKIKKLIEDGGKADLIEETKDKESHYSFLGKLYQRVTNFFQEGSIFNSTSTVTNLMNAVVVGNYFDTFARMYYNNPDLTQEQFESELKKRKDYKQLSQIEVSKLFEESKKRFSDIKAQIQIDLKDDNLEFITDNIFVHSNFKNGEWDGVAGTLDMVVVDSKGKVYIYDFKTKTENSSKVTVKGIETPYQDQETSQQKWTKQQTAYSRLFKDTFGYVPDINIIVIPVTYDKQNFTGKFDSFKDRESFKPAPSNVKFGSTPFIYKLKYDENNKLVVVLNSLKPVSPKTIEELEPTKTDIEAKKADIERKLNQKIKENYPTEKEFIVKLLSNKKRKFYLGQNVFKWENGKIKHYVVVSGNEEQQLFKAIPIEEYEYNKKIRDLVIYSQMNDLTNDFINSDEYNDLIWNTLKYDALLKELLKIDTLDNLEDWFYENDAELAALEETEETEEEEAPSSTKPKRKRKVDPKSKIDSKVFSDYVATLDVQKAIKKLEEEKAEALSEGPLNDFLFQTMMEKDDAVAMITQEYDKKIQDLKDSQKTTTADRKLESPVQGAMITEQTLENSENHLFHDIGLIRTQLHSGPKVIYTINVLDVNGKPVPAFTIQNNKDNFLIDLVLFKQFLEANKDNPVIEPYLNQLEFAGNKMPFVKFLEILSLLPEGDKIFDLIQGTQFELKTEIETTKDIVEAGSTLKLFNFERETLDSLLQKLVAENNLYDLLQNGASVDEVLSFLNVQAKSSSPTQIPDNGEVLVKDSGAIGIVQKVGQELKGGSGITTGILAKLGKQNILDFLDGFYAVFPASEDGKHFLRGVKVSMGYDSLSEDGKQDFKVGLYYKEGSKDKNEYWTVKVLKDGQYELVETSGMGNEMLENYDNFVKWLEDKKKSKKDTKVTFFELGSQVLKRIFENGRVDHKIYPDNSVKVMPKKEAYEKPIVSKQETDMAGNPPPKIELPDEEPDSSETKPISFKIEKKGSFVTVTDVETVGFDPVTSEPVMYILKSGVKEEDISAFTNSSKKRTLPEIRKELITESGFYNVKKDISLSTISNYQLDKIKKFIEEC